MKKTFLLVTSATFFFVAFLVDIVRKSVDIDFGWIGILRNVIVIAAFFSLYLFIESVWKQDPNPAKKLGFALVVTFVIGIISLALSFLPLSDFDSKNYILIPLGFDSIVLANIYAIVLGTTMILVLLILRDIIFSKRRKGTRRNFLIFLFVAFGTAASTFMSRPLETSIMTSVLFGLTIVAILLNSFRLSWIVYLSRREKLFSMLYGTLLMLIFIGFDIELGSGTTLGKAILFYSPPLKSFITSVSIFSTVFFGMTFLSTLFHLPTAEAFDRKMSEVVSLHNLGKLVTQVFDFNELVDSVTRMTLEVCHAQSSWLEIIREKDLKVISRTTKISIHDLDEIETVGLKNISQDDAFEIAASDDGVLRKLVFDLLKPVVIDDVRVDKHTKQLREVKHKFASMVIVPLLSHGKVIGILYATKDVSFGFDQEDVDLISAFADQATIAIENSRLIEKSLERERLMREIMLAQEMQKKLLPQHLPVVSGLEIEALSTPAFEVGGDYYDFTFLDEHHLGILVGDVSGKGVSAAFYMAEMKGIFQSLSKIYPSPKEFLTKAHIALSGTIDKRSFISVIYAIIDIRDGTMTVARAGHCPMLYITQSNSHFLKPTGLGLGMGTPEFFQKTIQEERVQLSRGDVALFFTDGVVEARPNGGDEFGYERLLEFGKKVGSKSAVEIRDALIGTIDKHMNHQPPEDDFTLVVIKWLKHQ